MNQNVKQLRSLTRLSQVELSKKSGINRVRLSLAENGELKLVAEEQQILLKILVEQVVCFSNELAATAQQLGAVEVRNVTDEKQVGAV